MEIGKKIEGLLKEKPGSNMSQLAVYCGVSPQAVQQWIAQGRFPRGARLKKIAKFFEISEAELFNGLNESGARTPQNEAEAPVAANDPGMIVDEIMKLIAAYKNANPVERSFLLASADNVLERIAGERARAARD